VKKQGKRIPQYVRRLRYLHAIGAIPRVGIATIDILHDPWCDLLAQRGPCNCLPEVKIRHGDDATRRN
jgi:hypothetical protein